MNPFVIKGYVSPAYFCDRNKETNELLNNILNGSDTMLLSPRRYGKTGLILHAFNKLTEKRPEIVTIYADIFATLSLADFIKTLADAIAAKFPEKTNAGKKLMTFLKGLRPFITYDPVTDAPQIQFNFVSEKDKEYTLKGLLDFLNDQQTMVILAIDEFQQIREYPEKNTEAMLRSCTQHTNNIRYIFSGSKQHVMAKMFHEAGSPFFSSAKSLSLDKIDAVEYASFIRHKFEDSGIKTDDEAIDMILDWSRRHTFYTQSLCNQIYSMSPDHVNINAVESACSEILDREAPTFLQYRSMLTPAQWKMLIAIAKEDKVRHITSASFLSRYRLSNATTAKRSVLSLAGQELLMTESTKEGTDYLIYKLFFSRWLQREY